METVPLGTAQNGAVAHFDRLAHEADGVIVLGRVKTHPESAGELASGLLKMCTIGLGKQAGAQEAHTHKLWDSVRAVPRLQLAKSNILFGVAVVENGYRQPVEIQSSRRATMLFSKRTSGYYGSRSSTSAPSRSINSTSW